MFPTYAHELWASQAAPAGHLLFMKWCISRHCMRQAKLLVPPQSSSISLPIWTNFHYTSDWKLCRTQHPQQQTCGEKRKFLTPFLGTMLCYVLVASYILTRWNVFKIGWETAFRSVHVCTEELYRPDLPISTFYHQKVYWSILSALSVMKLIVKKF